MALVSGARLGPYEILAPLGQGGMGEVYRGTDVRLDRTVAIKILSQSAPQHSELQQRFEREARIISSLSHPHICALYDVGHQDGVDYLVMEYLEGETLADRLRRSRLSLDQTLQYSTEIAEALDHAHRGGIVHRDLKPANVMLTRSGSKLMDFGLAKLRPGGVADGLSTLATGATPTAQGTILGTMQYMAPEQLEGKEADGRADIFALGAMMYEMSTGRRAFQAGSPASLIAAILDSEPAPVSTIQSAAPPALDRIISKCLAKERDKRWQSARDLADELRWVSSGGPISSSAAPVIVRKGRKAMTAALVAAACLVLGIGVGAALFYRPPADVRAVRLEVSGPDGGPLASGTSPVVVSPDGRLLAFVAPSRTGLELWVRPLDSLTANPLAGTVGASYPFWSPDSQFIAFYAEGKLKKVGVSGGPPQTLSDGAGVGGSWGSGGTILLALRPRDALYRVSSAGGELTQVTQLDAGRHESSHRFPHFLPDGRHFLFLVWSGKPDENWIHVGSLDSTITKRLVKADSNLAYAPPGFLLFVREGTLLAQPFDLKRLEMSGDSVPVAEQVEFNISGSGLAAFSASESGVLVYSRASAPQKSQLIWFDRSGKSIRTIGQPGPIRHISLSPDDKQVALEIQDPRWRTSDIWVLDLARGNTSRLTFETYTDYHPLWSPDGKQIVFASNRNGPGDLYRVSATGGNEGELLHTPTASWPTSWSPDGRFIIFHAQTPTTKGIGVQRIWALPVPEDRKPQPLVRGEFRQSEGQLSPDGKWLAYTAYESGPAQVYVQSFPDPGNRFQISTTGGTHPRWSKSGKELFFLSGGHRLMVVGVRDGAALEFSNPGFLFELNIPSSSSDYAVAADGQRVLVNTVVEEAKSLPTTVVLNWTAGLKRH